MNSIRRLLSWSLSSSAAEEREGAENTESNWRRGGWWVWWLGVCSALWGSVWQGSVQNEPQKTAETWLRQQPGETSDKAEPVRGQSRPTETVKALNVSVTLWSAQSYHLHLKPPSGSWVQVVYTVHIDAYSATISFIVLPGTMSGQCMLSLRLLVAHNLLRHLS